jgi:hypothetical protein
MEAAYFVPADYGGPEIIEILSRKLYSSRPQEHHLDTILAHIDDPMPYVTWLYNKQTDELFWGHYFRTLDEAMVDFDKRSR